ncbi:MAG: DUF1361 domain-containing protein [Flavobacteriales bacterium]|nr:DUF1361 domain-containing protein [Flavobacteriales bacterium]
MALLKKFYLSSVFVATLFCFILISLRVYFSGHITFIFLVWNLFLAWIPYLISQHLTRNHPKTSRAVLLLLGCVWLLFFPNAPYLLTDLIHLKPRTDAPFWFDLILLISFSWTGVLMAYKSLHGFQQIVHHYFGKTKALLFVVSCSFLSGYGIYLGRFQRYNSWDVLTNPVNLLYDIKSTLFHPFAHLHTYGVSIFFGLFLLLGYYSIFKLRSNEEL